MTTRYFLFSLLLSVLTAILPAMAPAAMALEADYFPHTGVLASGRWIKVSVDTDGLYRIPASTLRSWGFADASRVRVYGMSGARMPDVLTPANVPSDLPLLQNEVMADGSIVFYASGPGSWIADQENFLYYEPNIYSSKAYYFITESDVEARAFASEGSGGTNSGNSRATTFNQYLHHEKELTSPGEAGPLLTGEDFRYTPTRDFDFRLPASPVAEGEVGVRISFVSRYTEGTPSLTVNIPGTTIANYSTRLTLSGLSKYTHGAETIFKRSGVISPDHNAGTTPTLRATLSLKASSTPAISALNSITIRYERALAMPSDGYLLFTHTARNLALTTERTDGLKIWNVTDPMNIASVATSSATGGRIEFDNANSGLSFFAAFLPNATLPAPTFEQAMTNRDLHAMDSPDMVIISPQEYMAQAQRLADYHASSADSLHAEVINTEDIYNAFSAGRAEPAGIRNFLKMLYDRGSVGEGRPLRYLIIMGRMTFDNRRFLDISGKFPTVPGWSPRALRTSLSDNEGYFTDDFYAMLDDNSCNDMRRDSLRIAVGRVPVTNASEAKNVVDKTLEYARGARRSAWKQRLLLLADDGDRGIHLRQSEGFVSGFFNKPGVPFIPRKIYLDAFTRQGGIYVQARENMYRDLDEGVVWWNFIGHASPTSWTGDGVLSYSDLNSLYLRHLPFIYAATCDFVRLDASNISGAELIYKERNGGCIGVISATRPVYIAENGPLSAAVGRALAIRDANGLILPPGEIYRRAKNDIRDSYGRPQPDDNRLRYVFIGDPALRLAVPSNQVIIDSINGTPVGDEENPPVIQAMSRSQITGHIRRADGYLADSFNGTITIDIMDAEETTTTTPEDDADPENFEELGSRVFTGAAKVENGRFSIDVAMPSELRQNYRPAAIGTYAYDENTDDEAAGFFRDFYVYGYDEDAPADNNAPVIESIVLNHSSFRNGDIVNPSPMVIARVTDDIGINISGAGIGHQLTLTLDSLRTYNDVASYYTPYSDGTPGGIINYPLEDLTDGVHSLQLRVWDTSGNSERAIIDFGVASDLAPKIYDIYSDANPASTVANFYLSHDRPDSMIDVTVTVYDLLGHAIWSGSSSGRSDMFLSIPVSWDLTDSAGRRVNRGIYLYRATITDNGRNFETATRKIAVTAR